MGIAQIKLCAKFEVSTL